VVFDQDRNSVKNQWVQSDGSSSGWTIDLKENKSDLGNLLKKQLAYGAVH